MQEDEVVVVEQEQQTPEPDVSAEPESTEINQDEGEVANPETQAEKRRRSAQERINEITKAKYQAEREAAYWRGIAEGGKQPQQVVVESPPVKPELKDFNDYGEYIEALTDWKTSQKMVEYERRLEEKTFQKDARSNAQGIAQAWAERQDAVRSNIPDYDEVLGNSQQTVSSHVTDVLLTSDRGPEVAYLLAKNPAIAAKLNNMSPLVAAREIGRIEAALEKPSKTTKSPAPPPPTPARAGRTSSNDTATMSHEDYRAMRAKQGARWAR